MERLETLLLPRWLFQKVLKLPIHIIENIVVCVKFLGQS